MSRLILIRHAEVESKFKSICYGNADVPLSDDGKALGCEVAMKMIAEYRPDWIYHSGLSRTRHLAEQLAKGLRSACVVEDHRLRERDYGQWQGLTWDEVFEANSETFHDLIHDPDHYCPGGGETTTQMQSRIVAWYNDLCRTQSGSTIVAVSHSGPIAALAGHCLGLHAKDWAPWTLKNLQMIQVVRKEANVTVQHLAIE